MHEYTPIVSFLFDMIVLYYWRREAGRERGGTEIIAGQGVAVSEEMKEGAVRFGRAWSERGRKDRERGT